MIEGMEFAGAADHLNRLKNLVRALTKNEVDSSCGRSIRLAISIFVPIKIINLPLKQGGGSMLKIFKFSLSGSLMFVLIVLGMAGMAAGDDLAAGKSLFEAKCQICHGANGRGDGPAANALNPKPRNFNDPAFWQKDTDALIKRTVKTGKGMMPPFNLDDDEIKAITDYMNHAFK
jgi:mono/diheme cytochrome c family protein